MNIAEEHSNQEVRTDSAADRREYAIMHGIVSRIDPGQMEISADRC